MTDATPASRTRRWSAGLVFGAYLLLAFAAAWPLSANLTGLLPGEPGSDTGVYVWNLWTFRHQLLAHGSSPLWTDHVLQPGPPVDLALHNYTIFQNTLGLPLVSWFGLVGAFNVVWIAMQALSGLAVFLLARRFTSRDGVAFLAGVLFAFSPTMIARSTAHQSLVAAAPLAFFLLFVLRAADTRTLRDAAFAGVCAAWAGICDAYYGVYCVPMLLGVGIAYATEFDRRETRPSSNRLATLITAMMLLPIAIIIVILVTGGGRVDLFGLTIRARTIYTPMLALTVLVIIRMVLAMRARGRWRVTARPDRRRLAQVLVGSLVCVALLSPLIHTARQRIRGGGVLQDRVLWRSSPPGVDLLWFFVPNPNHPLAPDAFRAVVTTRPDSYPENVASLPWAAMASLAVAFWRRHRAPRLLTVLALLFGLLALGPFVTIAGGNTSIPGPWSVLRYLPVLGAARTPTRFAIPFLLAFALLFAWALDRIGRRRAIVAAIGAALAFELLPVPRLAASAGVPRIYETIAADPEDVSVLEIPFGIWDGTSQTGFPNIAAVYFQTRHQKRVAGGYLSRVPRRRVREQMSYPTLRLIARLSERAAAGPNVWEAARADAEYFVQHARVRYVVVDPRLASPELRRTVVDVLKLRLVQAEDGLELYRTSR